MTEKQIREEAVLDELLKRIKEVYDNEHDNIDARGDSGESQEAAVGYGRPDRA